MFTLPDFPWDRLAPYKERALAHPDGIVDLSVGTPVDPTPEPVRAALAGASDAPGYPQTHGTPQLREAVAGWLRRRAGVSGADPDAVLPVLGTKELVAWLPTLLGAGPGDRVVFPELAYPTYDVGARLAGATPVAADGLLSLGPVNPAIVWVNSPSNPTGKVLPAEHLRKVVAWARGRGALVVSDECYLEFGWDEDRPPVSILHPEVCEGSHEGLLAVNSLSKRSNMAGYRAGFVTGDLAIVKRLLEVRKHAGMIVPAPVQAAMTVAFGDDAHVDEQRARYARRRAVLRAAFERHGFRVDHSEASIYLWATRDEPCWDTVAHLASLGVLVGPGEFYGPAGARHVRIAFTATDERVAAADDRL
ncbi:MULTISPECIES: succinyldiaminopimelate transaminase [Actinomadura]|uniref:Aminotransferase n=1 Tax=Actinomadura madurae TaxID=1993 RepID=A0A1I5N3N9_9ACTN|nr:succinyldiaminopimelate transaminase [Actinomadura madurae]SFP16419.1 succinyldiaminopimelate transaminase [Actinomadura madurae]SPT50305.1 LL-diaminopimelate aminotransferase [Actinomadura madurae]